MKICTSFLRFFLLVFLVQLLSVFSVSAQDLIIFRDINTGEVQAKVKAVRSTHVSYTPFDKQDTKPIKVNKRKIEVIIFEDGMKQYFAAEDYQPDTLIYSSPGSNFQSTDSRGFYYQGMEDAKVHYKKSGPLWGTLVPTAVPGWGVVLGALSGGIIAAVPPNIDPYQMPNPELYLNNQEYARGYEKQVMRRKLGKVLTGYGIGIAIQTVVIIIIVNSW